MCWCGFFDVLSTAVLCNGSMVSILMVGWRGVGEKGKKILYVIFGILQFFHFLRFLSFPAMLDA